MEAIGPIPDRIKAICDIEAEEAVLGSMLEERDSIPKVISILGHDPKVFYKSGHQAIYSAIMKLFDNNEPADPISVAAELKKRDQINLIGGAIYLWDLVQSVPTAANVEYYAKLVREKAIRRELIATSREIISRAQDVEVEVDQLLDEAEQRIFDVSHSREQRSFSMLRQIIKESVERIEALYHKKEHIIGVPTGFWEFDYLTSGLQPSELIIIAGRPSMGKSVLAHNIARYVGVVLKKPVALFTLEMPKEDVILRMLAAEAKIDFHKIRTGYMTEEDWLTMTQAAGRLEVAPIYIDDTPGLNILELKALTRRLKAEREDLSLVIVDYLQLMVSGRRVESRQQEISEISRSLKELARELKVPVLALSQLNRAVENRADHRPQLSDLRESGCLTGETLIVLEDGRNIPISELEGKANFRVLALNPETLKLEPMPVSRAFSTGVKPVFKLKTRLGREIRATGNHQFLTIHGWKRLDELQVGDYLALPRLLPVIRKEQTMTDAELALLGHLIGDGCKSSVAVLAESDIYWDRIVSIESDGEERVYDLTVPGHHNFIANNIIVHNSLEQDADLVAFIHREDYYDEKFQDQGDAELIIKKQRNGPLGVVKLKFLKRQMRFISGPTRKAMPGAL
ncbi:replicative DNA helicase [Candidatus Poribacteria bacterium]|nr:replicative DNA helicase [Candidatus Poribacteria bacterium]